ncbi:hypothetical protein K431DRAFT_322480 [Polychaeton citri CBS 116435]|uniref:DNA repair protein RAD16 n=1 Tax=Polychaeton citri CBS 116435 TaxID=1314669 RepID=A0A9P4ULY8_9PEZI|nr:hypothetical protein K431DRAFT_322480 [Polychaeton citri CBS 116435]
MAPLPPPKPVASSSKGASPSNSSTDTSGNASVRDSEEYETPGTTPATSVRGVGSKRKRSGLGDNVLNMASGSNGAATAGGGGGVMVDDDDEALARQLQQEEYEKEEKPNKRQKTPALKVHESEDEESELSELSELSSVESEISEPIRKQVATARGKGKAAQKLGGKPVRKASSSARKSIRQIRKIRIEDSDESGAELLSDEAEAKDNPFQLDDSESEAVSTDAGSEDGQPAVPARRRATTNAARSAAAGRGRRGRARPRRTRNPGNTEQENAEDLDNFEPSGLSLRRLRERRKLEASHPEIKTLWTDLSEIPVIQPVPAQQPDTITRKLKSFQLEGLDWMMKQEQSQYKGGLLGDEMGMGKTIQAVSLIMSDYPQKAPSLVVVPPVALMQWSTEIGEYTNGKLQVLVYHGQNTKVKQMTVKDLKKYDVIMISYNSLESLYRKQEKGWSRGEDLIKEDSPIHAIHFHRVILDEAHCIKQRTTGVAKAAFALTATYKWCLSGTPVQNRIGEFFSLLRFLEVRPFADYFCKRCPCSLLHWNLDEHHICKICKHNGMEHVSVFNQELLNPLTQSDDPEARSAAMDKLHMMTARIMLRRVKKDYVSSMELPMKEVVIDSQFFSMQERDFNRSVMTRTTRQFDSYVARGVLLNEVANVFSLITMMRQAADHPDLILRKKSALGQNVLICEICDETAEDGIRSKCKHEFCRSCVKTYIKSVEDNNGGDADCPRCHIPLAIDLDQPEIEQDEEAVKKNSIINRIKMEDWHSSTKIEALVYELYKLRSKKQTLKSIVFSQFSSMLALIEWRLRRAGFNTVLLDGSMTPIQRQRSIDYFMTNANVEVFLVSLKAGGVALNLTEASRVFIIDPWWNPAAEWQSADRCHRIGQTRPCVITRLCVEDSIESRIIALQEKKANLINSTIEGDKSSMDKLTPEDMQFLFRGT